MRHLLFCTVLAIIAAGLQMQAQEVRWAHTPNDSVEIKQILQALSKLDNPMPTDAARFFMGRPYMAATLEEEPEMLTVRTDVFDCTTFVETCIALAEAAFEPEPKVEHFLTALKHLRYRYGEVNGYASRLHYISEWIFNTDGELLAEVTQQMPGADVVVKNLNFMSTHPGLYPALKDDQEAIAEIEQCEEPYQDYEMPYIPKANVGRAVLGKLKEGDVVAFTTAIDGLDVSHIGLITIKKGVAHLTHASSSQKKIVTTPGSVADYLRANRKLTGIRVFRPIR